MCCDIPMSMAIGYTSIVFIARQSFILSLASGSAVISRLGRQFIF